MTKKEIFILMVGLMGGLMLQIYSVEISNIAPIFKENAFEILMLCGMVFIIIKMYALSDKKQ